MTVRVRFTRDAVGDRERLEKFLAEQNPTAAERAMDAIADAVGQLSAYPRSGVDLGKAFTAWWSDLGPPVTSFAIDWTMAT